MTKCPKCGRISLDYNEMFDEIRCLWWECGYVAEEFVSSKVRLAPAKTMQINITINKITQGKPCIVTE
jgi:hypothetical protein